MLGHMVHMQSVHTISESNRIEKLWVQNPGSYILWSTPRIYIISHWSSGLSGPYLGHMRRVIPFKATRRVRYITFSSPEYRPQFQELSWLTHYGWANQPAVLFKGVILGVGGPRRKKEKHYTTLHQQLTLTWLDNRHTRRKPIGRERE